MFGINFYIAVASIIATFSFGIYMHHMGVTSCESKQAQAIIEGEKKYEKTYIDVQKLADNVLRREFCKWVRDTDVSTCVKNLAPFR